METAADHEATLEDEVKLEPEKEKNTPSYVDQDYLDYCSMEAIAERWKSKPRESGAASMHPEAEKDKIIKLHPPSRGPRARSIPLCYWQNS